MPLVEVDIVEDGENPTSIPDESLDFVIASHVIEHCEDPVGTIKSWLRVLRPGGKIFLVVPDRRRTFDRTREPTTAAHLLRDHREGPEGSREAHYREWVAVSHPGDPEAARRAADLQEEGYRVHFHVWNPDEFADFVRVAADEEDLPIELKAVARNFREFIVVIEKRPPGTAPSADTGLAPVMLNQLARYSAVVPLIREVAPKRVLEVGSGSEGLARFMGDQFEITICDRDFTDYGTVELGRKGADGLRRVEGDVTELPFEDGEFDLVLALDLIEHVPPELRDRALSELARVSSGRTIVGCPCGTPALESDRRLAAVYDRLPKRERPTWLAEHLENGFPEGEDLARPLREFGRVEVLPNEGIRWHQFVSVLEATPLVIRPTLWIAALLAPGLRGDGGGPAWRGRLMKLLRGHDRAPAYRNIAVLDREVRS